MSTTALERRVLKRYREQLDLDREPRHAIEDLVSEVAPLLDPPRSRQVVSRILDHLVGLGPLEPLLADERVTDVLVNGPGEVWVERSGRLERTGVTVDPDELGRIVERALAPIGLRADRAHPIVDGRLPDGSRISVVLSPLALHGPIVAIRRFAVRALGLDAFACPPVVDLLEILVRRRLNVIVYGGTGSGKTTFLNALAAAIPRHERIVTVEDAAELRLPGDHVIPLEARPPNSEGVGAVHIRDLVRAALRLRPDRIIVGEVRGAEALDMVWALSSGHDGSFSTIHASTSVDALLRLETFVLTGADLPLAAVRAQVWSAVDCVVGVARATDGRRRIHTVHELTDDRRLRCLVAQGVCTGEPPERNRGWCP